MKDIANLIYTTKALDSDGFPSATETKTEVYVNKKSVKRAEFYAAMNAGVKPSITFELRAEDWELTRHTENGKVLYADKIEFDSCNYDIIRTYEAGSMVELVCG